MSAFFAANSTTASFDSRVTPLSVSSTVKTMNAMLARPVVLGHRFGIAVGAALEVLGGLPVGFGGFAGVLEMDVHVEGDEAARVDACRHAVLDLVRK